MLIFAFDLRENGIVVSRINLKHVPEVGRKDGFISVYDSLRIHT